MLQFKLSDTGVLEVIDSQLSFKSTKVTYWYFNLRIWVKSKLGVKDEPPSERMTQEQIDWVRKHYVPKVEREIRELRGMPDLVQTCFG